MQLSEAQINAVLDIARQAGNAILDIYHGTIEVTYKEDHSPLTQADQASHRVIVEALSLLTPDIPIVSEESPHAIQQERLNWSRYWLIDPLDGTKEFIKRNGEFTVNIALIESGQTSFGVVGVPVLSQMFWGGKNYGAFRQFGEQVAEPIHVVAPVQGQPLQVVGSRSHTNQQTLDYLADKGPYELQTIGSSLKFCLIAEGKAHLYPRMGPTCEWDTAAAQAVLDGAGGAVVELETGCPLRYSKINILNPFFVATWQSDHKS